MHKSKLFQLLSYLTPAEMDRLQDVVDSPVLNKHADVRALFDLLVSGYPDFSGDAFGKQQLFSALYPGKPFNDLRLRHIASLLLGLAEKSLVMHEMLSGFHFNQTLMGVYARKGLKKHFAAAGRRAERLRGETSPESHHRAFELGLTNGAFPGAPAAESQRLAQTHDHLDLFYVTAKLRQACIHLSRHRLYQADSAPRFLEETLQILAQPFQDAPLVLLYRAAIDMQRATDDPAHFTRFKTHLHNFAPQLDRHLAVELHILARNFCIHRINAGDAAFTRQLFDLYKMALHSGFLTDEDGHIPAPTFKNIVINGLKLAEFAEIEAFIHDHADQLPPDLRADYLHFSLGKLAFEKGEFREAARTLQRVRRNDLYLDLDARILLIKVWYKLDEIELLAAAIQRTRQFVRRSKVIGYHKENYQNFLKMVEKLGGIRSPQKHAEMAAIVKATEPLTEKNWLQKELQERK
ncbi:MAG: hypothetical protein AAF570_20725 [Bacteroidota bacterium]